MNAYEEHPLVPALAMLCVCGHDLGDHLADAPHACEPCAEVFASCPAFVSAREGTDLIPNVPMTIAGR